MRVFAVLRCFVATGCSPSIELPPASYVPPSPPSAKAEYDGANQAAVETKLTGSVEISDVRESDRSGPLRGVPERIRLPFQPSAYLCGTKRRHRTRARRPRARNRLSSRAERVR